LHYLFFLSLIQDSLSLSLSSSTTIHDKWVSLSNFPFLYLGYHSSVTAPVHPHVLIIVKTHEK
jgi:hypothetical protein